MAAYQTLTLAQRRAHNKSRRQHSNQENRGLQYLASGVGTEVEALNLACTSNLSGSTYPTLSIQLLSFAIPAARLEAITDQQRITGSIFHAACDASSKILDDYHCKTGSAQAIATILDPRCKLQVFRNLSWVP